MPAKPGFYAVRIGWIPGVYHTWNECQDQVKGVSGARFKKFDRMEEAWAFVNQPPSPRPSRLPPVHSQAVGSVSIGRRVQVSPFPEPETTVDGSLDLANSHDRVDVPVERTNSEGPEAGKAGGEEDEKEMKKKRRRGPSESPEPVVEVDDKRTETDVEETTPERPVKRRRRRKAKHVSAAHSPDSNITTPALRTFFSSYRNPEVLSRLEEIGFGPHELLTMKGLRVAPIVRRFRQLIGNTPQSTAQVESLAFAVTHASAEAWNGLERHIK